MNLSEKKRTSLHQKTEALLKLLNSLKKGRKNNLSAKEMLDLRNFLESHIIELSAVSGPVPLPLKEIRASYEPVIDYYDEHACREPFDACICETCFLNNPGCFSEKMMGQINELQQLMLSHTPEDETPVATTKRVPKKILVVEDDRMQTNLLKYKLYKDGYVVESAENGIQALEILTDKRFDLIICDVMMPGMDGFMFIQKLKEMDTHDSTPFVFLSSASDERKIIKGLALGASDYLTKPYSPTELSMRIKKLLAKG